MRQRGKPLREGSSEPLEPAAPGAAFPASILIVDNNEASSKLARDALALDGYDVQHPPDINVAKKMLSRAAPTPILMAIALPGVDGLARALKWETLLKPVPIGALPGSAAPAESAYRAG